VIVHTPDRHVDHPGTCGVLAIDAAAARWAEVAGVDVAAVGLGSVRSGLAPDVDVVLFESSERHMSGAGCSLAILAVALAHAQRLSVNRISNGTAQALSAYLHGGLRVVLKVPEGRTMHATVKVGTCGIGGSRGGSVLFRFTNITGAR